jgi:hypothetical protein
MGAAIPEPDYIEELYEAHIDFLLALKQAEIPSEPDTSDERGEDGSESAHDQEHEHEEYDEKNSDRTYQLQPPETTEVHPPLSKDELGAAYQAAMTAPLPRGAELIRDPLRDALVRHSLQWGK